jgi:hypothetical protein
MTELATRLVYAALARYEGRPFTPVVAVLMEDAANQALRKFFPDVEVCIGGRLVNGNVDIRFKRKLEAAPAQ